MAAMLFRGLKGVNLSCTSPTACSIAAVPDHRTPTLHRLRSKFPTGSTNMTSSSRRYLLDEDFADVVDFTSTLRAPSTNASSSSSSSSSYDDGLKLENLTREEHVNYLRSVKESSSFHGEVDIGSAWVRFHTVDGGDSPTITRLPRADPREVRDLFGVRIKRTIAGSPENKVRVEVESRDKGQVPLKKEIEYSSPASRDQVVELRVSLHCKGCAAKVRKHLSRMPGVTSFNIDFSSKKVTVIGDITPLAVLSSISKVKNAQLWPSSPPTSASFHGKEINKLVL